MFVNLVCHLIPRIILQKKNKYTYHQSLRVDIIAKTTLKIANFLSLKKSIDSQQQNYTHTDEQFNPK